MDDNLFTVQYTQYQPSQDYTNQLTHELLYDVDNDESIPYDSGDDDQQDISNQNQDYFNSINFQDIEDDADQIDPNTPIDQALKSQGIKFRVSRSYQKGARTKQGRSSNHSKLDNNGNPIAYDIVPLDGDFNKLKRQILSNPKLVQYFNSRGIGIIDESNNHNIAITGATGKHFHIGPDQWALRTFNQWKNGNISYSKQGGKIRFGNGGIVRSDTISDNEKKAGEQLYNNLLSNGYSPESASALISNMYFESKFNPDSVNKSSGARGLFQILNKPMQRYIQGVYKGNQLQYVNDYVDQKLYNNEKNAYFNNTPNRSNVGYLSNKLKGFKQRVDPEGATKDFYNNFERGGRQQYGNREQIARYFYNLYNKKQNNVSVTPIVPNIGLKQMSDVTNIKQPQNYLQQVNNKNQDF